MIESPSTREKLDKIEALLEILGDDEAIRRLETAPTSIVHWISVTDYLPDDDTTVLIADTENDVTSGFHDGDAGWRYCTAERVTDKVTHWAHIPPSPNAEVRDRHPEGGNENTENRAGGGSLD